jgi:hypothetical protein
MIDPTITQNGALYFAQHRAPKRRSKFEARIPAAAGKDRIALKQQRAFEDLLLWRLLHRADNH